MPGYCLPQIGQRRLPQLLLRGSITRPTDSLCTLRSLGYPNTAQHPVPTASTLGRVGLHTYKVPLRSFSISSILPLLPGLAWRTSGRRGRLLSPNPHRSGRAQLTHPAPHSAVSLRDYELASHALGCTTPLPFEVSLRYFWASMFPASFPPKVP